MTRALLTFSLLVAAGCSAQQPDPGGSGPETVEQDAVADGLSAPDTDTPGTSMLLSSMVRTPVVVDGRVPARADLPVIEMPLRDVGVELRAPTDNSLIWSGRTDADGRVTLPADSDAGVLVAIADASRETPIAVIDCPMLDCDSDATWAWAWPFAGEPVAPIPVTSAAAGAFHIRDALRHAQEFMRSFAPDRPPASLLTARWEPGSDTHCGTSCFGSGGRNSIFVYAVEDDTDEFDRQILMHEYTHFLEHDVFGSNGVGGYHDGSPAPPALAFSEGLCTGLATAASGSSEYIDTALLGGAFARYDAANWLVPPPQSPAEPYSEETVAAFIAWLLGPEGSEYHAAFGSVLMEQESFDMFRRYAPGFDIGDFFDLLRCRHSAPSAIDALAAAWGFNLRAAIECPAASPLSGSSTPGDAQRSPITPLSLSLDGDTIEVRVKTDIDEVVVERISSSDQGRRSVLAQERDVSRGWTYSWTIPSEEVASDEFLSVSMTMPGGAVYTHTGSLRTVDSLLAGLPDVVVMPEGRRLRLAVSADVAAP